MIDGCDCDHELLAPTEYVEPLCAKAVRMRSAIERAWAAPDAKAMMSELRPIVRDPKFDRERLVVTPDGGEFLEDGVSRRAVLDAIERLRDFGIAPERRVLDELAEVVRRIR